MPYRIAKSIDIDFAHHVSGHNGACINIHGHTWKFEVCLEASSLNETGFVEDFKKLKTEVLQPVHDLLDHSLALSAEMLEKIKEPLSVIGKQLLATRNEDVLMQYGKPEIFGACAISQKIGGLKVAAFTFTPTSERLAEWLYYFADEKIGSDRVRVAYTRVYETLHPVESVAEYRP